MTVAAILTTIVITRQDRSHADGQLTSERKHAQEQEQLAEAWSVQVLGVGIRGGAHATSSRDDDPAERPVAIVINRGRYTIRGVDGCFSNGSATHAAETASPTPTSRTCRMNSTAT